LKPIQLYPNLGEVPQLFLTTTLLQQASQYLLRLIFAIPLTFDYTSERELYHHLLR
jgi:hypothetical protein